MLALALNVHSQVIVMSTWLKYNVLCFSRAEQLAHTKVDVLVALSDIMNVISSA